jgi:hypothetical protein
MKILNELSGKDWIPPEVAGTSKGFYLDVPRRVYITGKLGSLTIGARTQGWLPILGTMPTKWPSWLTWWPIVYRPPYPKPGWLWRKHPELFHGGNSDKENS